MSIISAKKRVCIFCSLTSFNTGMPISTYKLAAGLIDGGGYGVCAALPCEGELADKLRGAGVDVEIIKFSRMRSGVLAALRFMGGWGGGGYRLCKYIRKNRVDIVHFSDVIDAPFYFWAKAAGAKVVGHVRVCLGGCVVRFLFRTWTRLFCDKMITISNFARRYYGLCKKRANVVYNPGPDRSIFDVDKYPTDRTKTSSSNTAPPNIMLSNVVSDVNIVSPPTVAMTAAFRRDKGHHNFIKIASSINKKLNGRVRFTIIGGQIDGHEKYFNEIVNAAKRANIFDNLTITGNIPPEQVAQNLSQATVLLHVPDWEEALGGAILEAMAMRAAVVAYDSGGIGECFTNGESGFLVKRDNAETVADKVIEIINDADLREKITTSALAELNKKFSLDAYINNITAIYGACCK